MAKDTEEQKRAELARTLDFFTSEELRALAKITPITEQAWRKRGTGPGYVIFGTQVLYPRPAVAEFLRRKLRVPSKSAKSTL